MSNRLKNSVLTRVVALSFMTMAMAGCNKYDKMNILGEWTIDLKEAKGLNVEIAKETLCFNSGSNHTYSETHEERKSAQGSWDRWEISGNFERKHNKITLSNRVKGTGEKMPTVEYKYRIEDDKLIFICKEEGFANDEKVYTKKEKAGL